MDSTVQKELNEKADVAMVGELYPRIINADAKGESWAMEAHALEALASPDAKALKRALFTDLGWRRMFLAREALKKLGRTMESK